MDLTIEQNCPGCGGEIELHEDDRLIRCAFCDANNYMLGQGGRRFVLPWLLPEHISEHDLIFVPYIRFKGAIFYVHGERVRYKIVDTTRLAIINRLFPVSLGLRPQAMRVRPIVGNMAGSVFRQTEKTRTIFSQVVKISTLFIKEKDEIIQHRAFIGESLSRIYQPYYIHGEKLFDAVDNRPVGVASLLPKKNEYCTVVKNSWEPQFISSLCPKCGDNLEGERDSLVLCCTNCETLWQEEVGQFDQLQWDVVSSGKRSARYLPFWRITFQVKGAALESFGDFLRFTNQPLGARKEFDNVKLAFLLPAFKINPKVFLKLSSSFTVAQLRIPDGAKVLPHGNMYPVNLHWKEAFQAIKIVLAATTFNKKKLYSILPKINITSIGYSLKYLPFIANSHDLVQEHTSIAIVLAALKYGRTL